MDPDNFSQYNLQKNNDLTFETVYCDLCFLLLFVLGHRQKLHKE